MNRTFFRAALAVLLATPVTVTGMARPSGIVIAECRSCINEQGFKHSAKAYYGWATPTLFHLPTGVIRTYDVRLKRGYPDQVSPPPEALEANEIPTHPDVAEAFYTVAEFFHAAGGSFRGAIEIPASSLGGNIPGLNGSTTAYDVASDANLRNRIGLEIVAHRDNWNIVKAFVNKVNELFLVLLGIKDEAVLEVALVFADGSRVLYRITTKSENSTKLAYVEGSAMTPRKQLVPDANHPKYQGTWLGLSAGGDDMGRFGRHIGAIGGTASWPVGSGGGGGPDRVVCVWKENSSQGGTLLCAAGVN